MPQVAADENGEHRDTGDVLEHGIGVHGGLANSCAALVQLAEEVLLAVEEGLVGHAPYDAHYRVEEHLSARAIIKALRL